MAICFVHSDTVFVSLVVSGTAAFISTSAASHTFVNIHTNTGEKRVRHTCESTFILNKHFVCTVCTDLIDHLSENKVSIFRAVSFNGRHEQITEAVDGVRQLIQQVEAAR